MNKVNLTPEQLQAAVVAGLELFNDPNLTVPWRLRHDLSVLQVFLNNLHSGNLMVTSAPVNTVEGVDSAEN